MSSFRGRREGCNQLIKSFTNCNQYLGLGLTKTKLYCEVQGFKLEYVFQLEGAPPFGGISKLLFQNSITYFNQSLT